MIVLALIALSLLALGFAFTARRVWVLVIFYAVYGIPKILAMSDLLDWNELLLTRGLYAALCVSVLVRFWKDEEFLSDLRRFPLISYTLIFSTVLLSGCYSMVPFEKSEFFGHLSLTVLFGLAAWQMQREEDFKIMAGVTVFVALGLSAWIISLSAATRFSLDARGGGEVNQNFVSVWVAIGAFPLVQTLFTGKTKKAKLSAIVLLSFVLFGAFLLASRGMLVAFLAGLISMAPMMIRRVGAAKSFGPGLVLFIILSGSLLLPGARLAVRRFAEPDVRTLNGRTRVWSTAAAYLEDSAPIDWIFGNGISSGLRVLNTLTDDQWNYHNEYLGRLLDQGVVGLAAFLLFVGTIWRISNKSKHCYKPLMSAWLVFFAVGCLSGTLTDSHPFWLILGVITGACVLAHPLEAEKRFSWPRLWHESVRRDLAARGRTDPPP